MLNSAWAGEGSSLFFLAQKEQVGTISPHINIDIKNFQEVYYNCMSSIKGDSDELKPLTAKKSIAKTAKTYGVAALLLLGIKIGLSSVFTFWFESSMLTFTGIGLILAGFFGWQKMEAWLLPRLEKRVLVTEGPYQWAQHPFYTIQMLLPLGIFLAFPSQLALMTLYAFCLDALIRILYEHRHLYSQYGEAYRRYQQSGIPLLIPKLIPLMQYFANEIRLYNQTNYIYKNIFPKGTPGIEDILNAEDKISALDKINELRMLYPEIAGYYKADKYFTLFTDKKEITFKYDNDRIDISMISVDDDNAQTTVVPLTDEYVIDTPFEVFKDEIIDNGKFEEEEFKAHMQGNIFWEAPLENTEKKEQQQEIIKRARELSLLTTDIRDYFSQKFPSLEIVNISVHGSAIYGFPGIPVSDIDLVVIVKGKCLEYWEFPFESVILQGTLPIGSPEINFMIIGEENLQNPQQDYVHIRRHRLINIVESDICTAPWRFITLWGKDWKKTNHLENNLKVELLDLEDSAQYKIDQAMIAAVEAPKDMAKFLKQACGRVYQGYLTVKKIYPSLPVDFNEIIALQKKTAREKTSLSEINALLKAYSETIANLSEAPMEDIGQIAGQVVNALSQGDFDEVERLFGIFQSENIAEPRLDNAWIAKITEQTWQYIKEKAGSIDAIRNMDPEEFAQKLGVFTTEAALMPFVLDQPTAKLLKKIRQLYGGKEKLWQTVEIPILPLFQYPHTIFIMHPSIEKAGIYYSPDYMRRNDATLLNKSVLFHELLEKKFLENGIINRRFNYIFSHIHPRIIEEELKFAEVMGELPVMLKLRKGQLRAKSLQIEKELAGGKLSLDRAQDFIESAEWLEDTLLLYDQEADFFLEQGQSLLSEDQAQIKASMDKALQRSLNLVKELFSRDRVIEQSI